MRMARLEAGADLLEGVVAAARGAGAESGWVQGIGALDGACLAWYDQEAREYRERRFAGGLEIVSLAGNLSRREGALFPHIHLVLSGADCGTVGGHALPGCVVFATELAIWSHPPLERREDAASGLWLWPAGP